MPKTARLHMQLSHTANTTQFRKQRWFHFQIPGASKRAAQQQTCQNRADSAAVATAIGNCEIIKHIKMSADVSDRSSFVFKISWQPLTVPTDSIAVLRQERQDAKAAKKRATDVLPQRKASYWSFLSC